MSVRNALIISFLVGIFSSAFAELPTFRCVDSLTGTVTVCVNGSNMNLANQNHDGVNWSRGHFFQTNLEQSTLRHATLIEALFSRANLRGANLYGATLYGASMIDTDLRGADLRGTNLRATDLSTAVIDETTQLNGAAFDSGTLLPLAWGETWDARRSAATYRGMLPVRE